MFDVLKQHACNFMKRGEHCQNKFILGVGMRLPLYFITNLQSATILRVRRDGRSGQRKPFRKWSRKEVNQDSIILWKPS